MTKLIKKTAMHSCNISKSNVIIMQFIFVFTSPTLTWNNKQTACIYHIYISRMHISRFIRILFASVYDPPMPMLKFPKSFAAHSSTWHGFQVPSVTTVVETSPCLWSKIRASTKKWGDTDSKKSELFRNTGRGTWKGARTISEMVCTVIK